MGGSLSSGAPTRAAADPLKSERILQCGSRQLRLSEPRVMGILNVTPDSFSDGGRFTNHEAGAGSASTRIDIGRVKAAALEMLECGVDILDVGGESTRPGAESVTESEELKRVMPVIEVLMDLDTIVSVDTRKAAVARAALAAGVHLINDVTALDDPAMVQAIASSQVGVCLMHMQGRPATMQQAPHYDDIVRTICRFLGERVELCRSAGIDTRRLCIDPGFGFGKRLEHNVQLLRDLESIRVADLPILVGLSRKRMIGDLTGRAPDQRITGSVAAALLAVQRGADIVRVHDVAATVDALKILRALA